MVSVCFYFQVHQPFRLRPYSIFDINKNDDYFDAAKNISIMKKIEAKCYLPANKLMLNLIEKSGGRFKIAYSLSGVVLEQLEEYAPKAFESFIKLAETGQVEFLSETYHHSLSFLYSKKEFKEQVALHRKKIKSLFGQTPKVFRNTELIYNNELAKSVEDMGYNGILAEGWDPVLQWRSPNFVYTPHTCSRIKLLLKNYKLSDDVAFRFSNQNWNEWPLTVDKYAQWINANNGAGNLVNLFMDYETLGEHQWASTGIFKFMEKLPEKLLEHKDNDFVTPSEAIKRYPSMGTLDIHHPVSWADMERDLSAWIGNSMQQSALKHLYQLEEQIKKSGDRKLLENWRKLTTSDHFYYMCVKYFSDGDVHKYFNPYDNPYEGFISFMNVLNDMIIRMKQKGGATAAGSAVPSADDFVLRT